MWVRWALLSIVLVAFIVPVLTLACNPQTDPECNPNCGNTKLDAGEGCDGTAPVTGCGLGETCNSVCTDCIQTGCNNDGDCQTSVETEQNCPNDCVDECTPQCAGKVCGDDTCGGRCAPDSCSTESPCNEATGQCCTPSCPTSDPALACGSSRQAMGNCGQTCTIPGTKCTSASAPNCNLATGTCQQCTSAAQCDDQNACTIDTCTSGSCAHAPAAMGTTCPAGKCTANGLCWPVCTATPGCTSPQPPNTDQISSRYCDPRGDFSVDYCYACKSGYAWSGTACVASSCTIGTCTQGMAPYCSAGKSYTCVSGCLQAATCTNGCNATTGLCNGGASCTHECLAG